MAAWQAASEILGGFFVAVVSSAVFAEASEAGAAGMWGRVLERSWAVIIISLATDISADVGLTGLAQTGIADKLLAASVILITVSLTFASVDAVVSADAWWFVLPAAISRSMTISWRGDVFARALLAFVVGNIGVLGLFRLLEPALARTHAAFPVLLASGLSTVLLLPLVQTFATIVYLDANRR